MFFVFSFPFHLLFYIYLCCYLSMNNDTIELSFGKINWSFENCPRFFSWIGFLSLNTTVVSYVNINYGDLVSYFSWIRPFILGPKIPDTPGISVWFMLTFGFCSHNVFCVQLCVLAPVQSFLQSKIWSSYNDICNVLLLITISLTLCLVS